MPDDLDELLKQLKQSDDTLPVPPKRERPTINVSEDNISEYILQNASKLIETGLDSVESMRDVVSQSFQSEDVEAYAILIKAVTDSIETVNKINLQNKKSKTAKEIKQMEIDSKQQLGPVQHNTNVLIATRDEIIKGLLDAAKTPASEKVINVEDDATV